MPKLYCDLETYSPIPLKNGTHAYAEPAEVMLWTYAMDDGPVKCWDVTEAGPWGMPDDLRGPLLDRDVMTVWQNGGMFDRVVLKHALPELYNAVPIERWYDTMVQALAHSLPGSLDALCEIFKIDTAEAKHKDGRQLIRLFCIPPAANLKRPRATRHTHPAEWEQFKAYAMADISAMRAVHKKMPTWNYQGGEMALWHLDQKINMRGMCMDVGLAHAAIRAVERAQKGLAKRTVELTNGEVQKATQRDSLLKHLLAEYGVDLPDLQKSTLERRIDDPNLPWALRELLAIRLQASSTSTSKYKTLIKGVNSDGRLRGTQQFCGASRTGRWAHRGFQPGNMPRPTLEQPDIDFGIEALKADCDDLITGNVMELTSSAIRGCIIAPPGKKLVVADLSNIEGRVLAWLAGEKWKLKAFADYDTYLLDEHAVPIPDGKGDFLRVGHDLYKLAYAKAFGIRPEDATGDRRQIGKVMELALGFEGGVGAFLTFAAAYNLDLEAMAKAAESAIPASIWREAESMLLWTKKKKRSTFGLSDRAWMVCESFKRSWRQAHPEITSFWKDLGDTVKEAVARPGVTLTCRKLVIRREADVNWLRIRLPSRRFLCYPSPRVDEKGQFSYMGVNQYSRKWSRIKSYGGKLAENVTQAVARDVMAASMAEAERQGFEILLTVHDEIITETPDRDSWNHERLAALMSANPSWADGLPLAAAGFESYRYKKD